MESLKKYLAKIKKPFTPNEGDADALWFNFVYIIFYLTMISVALHLFIFFYVGGIKDRYLEKVQENFSESISEKAIDDVIKKFEDKATSYRFVEDETRFIKDPSI